MNHPVYNIYILCIYWFWRCAKRKERDESRGQNDFLSLQLLIMSGIVGETFKSIIRAGRLVLIKRQTT